MSWPWREKSNPILSSSSLEDLEKPLLTFFRKASINQEDAQDLVHDVLKVVADAVDGGKIAKDLPLDHYAFAIAFRFRASYFRKIYRRASTVSLGKEHEDAPDLQSSMDIYNYENNIYASKVIDISTNILSGDEQRVIALIYQGENQEEISEILGIPAVTVRSHLLRGRKKLLAELVEHYPDMLGGIEIIEEAWRKVLKENPPPTTAEICAWQIRKPVEAFRTACLKMARHLPSPLAD